VPKHIDSTVSVLAEIASYGAFLPGSVRKSWEKRRLKSGKVKKYEAQPIYTHTDPESGKQIQKRIPKEAYDRVRGLTLKYAGMKKLLARFEHAAVSENLDEPSKKNSSR